MLGCESVGGRVGWEREGGREVGICSAARFYQADSFGVYNLVL